MKKIIIIFLLIPLPFLIEGQVFYNNGSTVHLAPNAIVQINSNVQNQIGTINVSSGSAANLYITGNLTNNATINGSGNIHLKGDWINNSTFNCNTGLVLLEGANQQLSGSVSTTFYNLTLDGSGIKTQTIDQTTSGVLNLKDRELATNTFKMLVTNTDPNAIVRTNGFISSNNGGYLSRNTAIKADYLFPVGSSVGTMRYRQVMLTPATASNNTYTVRMANVDATTEGYNRANHAAEICNVNPYYYHQIGRSAGSDAVDMKIYYTPSEEGNWGKIGNWHTIPSSEWYNIPSSVTTTMEHYAIANNWNDFSNQPYALTREAGTINIGNDTTICSNTNLTIDAGAGYENYIWSNGGTNHSIEVNNSGSYSVIVTDGACTMKDTINVVVIAIPIVNLGTDISLCEGQSITLNAGDGADSYAWSNSATTQTISVTTSGNYSVTATNGSLCAAQDNINVAFNPWADASISSTVNFCTNDDASNLIAANIGGVWSGNGITNAQNGTFAPSIAGAGNHQVIYTISGNCGDTDTAIIVVNKSPEINIFSTNETCIDKNDGSAWIEIVDISSPYNVMWNNNEKTDTISSLAPNTYSITITSANGCTKNLQTTINKSNDLCYNPHIWVPNAFSPNSDGENDLLYVYGEGVREVNFAIYNRWGEKIFESNSLDIGWDGTYKGEKLSPGVFFYSAKAKFLNNTKSSLNGNITLVR